MAAPASNGNGTARLSLWLGIGASVCTFLVTVFFGGVWLSKLDGRITALETNTSSCQQFAKIETQFGIVETVLNKDNVDLIRWKSSVDQKLWDIQPPGIYYPIAIPHEITPCK